MNEENDGEIQRIKRYTKRSNSTLSSKDEGSEEQQDNAHKDTLYDTSKLGLFSHNFFGTLNHKLNINFNKNITRYLIVIFSYCLGVLLLIYAIDSFLLPALVYNRGSVLVPDVTGKLLKDGEQVLKNAELKPIVTTEVYSTTLPKGYIIKQLPISGLTVKSSRPIYLTVSKGKETVKMPNLINTSFRDARLNLMNLGLSIGIVTYEFSETIHKDSIMNQSIPYNKEVPYGEIVNIVISKGSETSTSTPNLVGMDYQGIEEYLQSFGFVLGSVNYRRDETFANGTIIEQFPLPYSVTPNGSIINIVVNKSE